jgi:hypothetical protein
LKSSFHKTYPLLTTLNRYNLNDPVEREKYMDHDIQYINCVDNGKF